MMKLLVKLRIKISKSSTVHKKLGNIFLFKHHLSGLNFSTFCDLRWLNSVEHTIESGIKLTRFLPSSKKLLFL